MPGLVRPVIDERDGLLAYLAQQRHALRGAVRGLTEGQAWATPTVSTLSLAALIKHSARAERGWIVEVMTRREEITHDSEENYLKQFRHEPGDTVAAVLETYAGVAAETEAIVAEIEDLGRPVPVPIAPWFPDDVEAWSVRWVLLHLIEETARHAGHADIIRESLDSTTKT
jgi:hypothetical protein